MIIIDTEPFLDDYLQDEYDDFFGNRSNRRARREARKAKRLARRIQRRSAPRRIIRREKRRQAFRDIGRAYRDIGGATAIGTAIDAITQPKLSPNTPTAMQTDASDYTIGVGSSQTASQDKKSIPTAVYILGGIVLLGGVGWAVLKNTNPQKQLSYSQ